MSLPPGRRHNDSFGHHYASAEEAYGGISQESGRNPLIVLAVVFGAVMLVIAVAVVLFSGGDDSDDASASAQQPQGEESRGEEMPGPPEDAGPAVAEADQTVGGELDGMYDVDDDEFSVLGIGDHVVRYIGVTDGESMNVTYSALGSGVEQQLEVEGTWALELRGDTYEDVVGSNLIVSPVGAHVVGCRMYYDGELVGEDEEGPGSDSAHCITDWYAFGR